MVKNLDDIQALFTLEEIELRRREIKERQDKNAKAYFVQKELKQAEMKKMRDLGHSRITITHMPRERDPKYDPQPVQEPVRIQITNTTEDPGIIEQTIDIIEPEEPKKEDLKKKIEELQKLIAELPKKTEE